MDLVEASGWRAWPAGLPEQPIFYPVLKEAYATKIAKEWNVLQGGVGHVTRFEVRKAFLDSYDVQQVGDATSSSTASRPMISTSSTATSWVGSNSSPPTGSATRAGRGTESPHRGIKVRWFEEMIAPMTETVDRDMAARLHLVAVGFVLPEGPRVQEAVVLAEDLPASGVNGPAILAVASLKRDAIRSEAEQPIREMLAEHGISVPIYTNDDDEYRLLLTAF